MTKKAAPAVKAAPAAKAAKPAPKAAARTPAKTVAKRAVRARAAVAGEPTRVHPRSVPIIAREDETDVAPEQPFAEGSNDQIDADLRYRMISDVAYRRYVERGYTDGGDVDDWLEAEAEVDHMLGNRD